ncbi:helix-turn-helix domain-containing protein [Nocardia sp. NBC_00565]|uniref:winged helix-turn-helix domain-containing protein n=1 Tax=Nocardia sp. NBC_00565 TaxID=2975993 RepID=UPI002E8220B6|nr:helix-turn-helix domain-containing protein [Nocardia sp. NBC_00565]WUC08248.1 helix-turn-helix domain-containing protein [Nocardia sp. NBC_00565]
MRTALDSLDVHMARLRTKLNQPHLIITLRGYGYQWAHASVAVDTTTGTLQAGCGTDRGEVLNCSRNRDPGGDRPGAQSADVR